jgi:tape measure domain-containing protein
MGVIADLMVHIGADTRDLESGFDRAGRAVGSMAKIVMAATAAGAAAIGAAAKIGIEYNSQMENYTTNMKVLLGSQEAAVKKMEELKSFAASTPFELGGLAEATQTLLAFEVPASETTRILKMLGDVSLGDSEKLRGLSVVFGQVSSAGKLQGQDLMQMINQGFNPLNYIAKRTGESMEELRDRMSKGAISAEEVTQAFEDATSAGGQFFNGMKEASKTMSGLISTLKDNARSLVGEVFVPISEGIKNTLLPQAIGYIDELTEAFREKGVEGLVEAAGEILSNVVTTLAEGAPRFVTLAVSLVESLLDGLIGNLPAIVDAAVEIGETLANGIIDMIPKFFDAGIEIILRLAQGLSETIPELIPSIVDAVTTMVETLIDNVPLMVDAGTKIFLGIIDGMLNAIPQIVDALPSLITSIVDAVIDSTPKIIEAGVKFFVSLVENLPDIINGIISNIPEIVDNVAASFASAENQKKMGEAGKTLISSLWNNAWDVFKEDWQKFLEDPWGGPGSKTWSALDAQEAASGMGHGGGGMAGGGAGRTGREEDAALWQSIFNANVAGGMSQDEAANDATTKVYGEPEIARSTTANIMRPNGYANGGYPAPGELFMADENNIYEFKGNAGGRPTVANNDQMEEAVASGNREVVAALERLIDAVYKTSGGNSTFDSERFVRNVKNQESRFDFVAGKTYA